MSELNDEQSGFEDTAIAIVGMACRFPGANSVHQYWQNLLNGVESIDVSQDQAGRIHAKAQIEHIECFDHEFSASASRRRCCWIRNNGCCSNVRGKRWKMPRFMAEQQPLGCSAVRVQVHISLTMSMACKHTTVHAPCISLLKRSPASWPLTRNSLPAELPTNSIAVGRR